MMFAGRSIVRYRPIVLILLTSCQLLAADGNWISTTGGNWSDPSKWSSATVADGSGATANFAALDPTADATVHLDGTRTLTNLVFGDTNTASAAGWILDNNGSTSNNLILAGNSPAITVNALGTGKSLLISAIIGGSAGMTKSGTGTLVLAGSNIYTGVTTVTGVLQLQHAEALAGSSGLTPNNGSSLQLRGDGNTTFVTPPLTLPAGGTTTIDVNRLASGSGNTLTLAGAVNFTYAGNSTSTINVTGGNNDVLCVPTVNLSNTGASGYTQTKVAFKPTTANVTLGNVNGITVGSGRDVYLVLDGTSTGNQVTGRIANPVSGLAWTFLIKQGTGTWTISNNSTSFFAGSAAVTAGILNVQVNNALGSSNRGTTVSSGATLQLQSATSLNYSTAEALTLTGTGVANAGALENVTGTNTFAGLLTLAGNTRINSDAGSLTLSHTGTITGATYDLTIGGDGDTRIAGIIGTTTGGLGKEGTGTLTLSGANTYGGATQIHGGTLALAASGSIAATSGVVLDPGAVLDLTAFPAYVWPVGVPLATSGGTLKGGTSIDLESSPLALNFTPTAFTGDSTHPALAVSAGTLIVNGTLMVSNNSTTPLGNGTYVLISLASGTISGTPVFAGTVAGQGIQAGKSCEIQINGGNLVLVVHGPYATSTTLARHSGTPSASVYGNALTFDVSVSPSTATGTVGIYEGGAGGTLIGTTDLTSGVGVIILADTALGVGTHSNLVARYAGNSSYLASTSAALTPAQSVTVKPLTIAGAAALDKYYDTTSTAAITGTLSGVETGDTVTLGLSGAFATSNPGTGIPVTSTSTLNGTSALNYTLIQPAGLTANIMSASVWTGGTGGTGTNLATGTNYSPTATTANPYNAIFNGLDPATTDLTLASAIGGGVGTNGMVFGFGGNQTNAAVLTGTTGASARVASVRVAPGAGAVTFQGVFPFTIGGTTASTNHGFANDSTNPLLFDTGVSWVPGNSGTSARSLYFSGSGDIIVRGNIAPSTASRMSLTKSGTGTLTLSGANTFSGATTITAGKIIAASSTAVGTGSVVNNGSLDLTVGAATYTGLASSLTGSGAVNVTLGTGTGSTLLNGDFSGFTGTWNIGIAASAGAGKVQMNGLDHAMATIHVLENATLYTTTGTHHASIILHGGNTGEALGQLRVEGTANWAGAITLAGDISGSGDGTVGANSGSGTISGNIAETGGPHGLVKVGNGTTVLSGIGTFTGPTTVSDGILLVNSPGSLAAGSAVAVSSGGLLGGSGVINGPVSIASGGTLKPGLTTPETLTVNNSVTVAGTLELRLDRSIMPMASRLVVNGTLICSGSLKALNAGENLQAGDTFVLFSTTSSSGTFAAILLPALNYGLKWNTSQLMSNGIIRVETDTTFTPSTISFSPGTFRQQIYGIGSNFAQGDQMGVVAYNRYDEFFSPQGLNLSFIRLGNTYELTESVFANQAANNNTLITAFRARQPSGKIMMTAWSPPGTLKSSGSPFLGTLAKTAGGQYRYSEFADWWVRSLQFYQANSALPDYLSIQNEPDFTSTSGTDAAWKAGSYLDTVESSTKAGYPQALAAVRSAFQASGFGSMKMIGPDTTAIGGDKVPGYLNQIPSGQITAIAHHLYGDNSATSGSAKLTTLQSQYPYWTMPKIMTEYNGDDLGPSQPSWMGPAITTHNVFALEAANAYLYWNIAWEGINVLTGLPNNNKYYSIGHYSKFVRPGDYQISGSVSDPNVLATIYRHYNGTGLTDQYIIVMINQSSSYSYPTLKTSAIWAGNPLQRAWKVYKTSDDGSTQQRLSLVEDEIGPGLGGDRNLVLAPYSLTTAVINGESAVTYQDVWLQQYFGSTVGTGTAAAGVDVNADGESNLYEFATAQDPFANTRVTPTVARNGSYLEFTYTRSKDAVADGVTFTVQWSGDLTSASWSSAGIVNQNPAPIAETATTETLRILVPAGTARRFVRLVVRNLMVD